MKKSVCIFLMLSAFSGPLFSETEVTEKLEITFTMEHTEDEGLYRFLGANTFSVVSEKIELDWSSDANVEISTLTGTDPEILINSGTFLDSGYLFYPFKLYLLAGAEKRESLALDYRVEGGIGGKVYFMKNDSINWSVSCIPLLLWEKYEDNEDYVNGRLSFRHKIVLSFMEKVIQLSSVVFYQPLFTDLINSYIINAVAVLTVKSAEHVSVVVKYMFDYDKNETLEVPKDTWTSVLSAGILLSF